MTSQCCNVTRKLDGQVTRDVDLELTSDQELFRDTTRQFLQAEAPLASVRKWADTPAGFDRAWWARGAELGWTSLLVSEERGGGSISGPGFREDGDLVALDVLESLGNVGVAAVAVGRIEEAESAIVAVEKKIGKALDAESGLMRMMAGANSARSHGETAGLDARIAKGDGVRRAKFARERLES